MLLVWCSLTLGIASLYLVSHARSSDHTCCVELRSDGSCNCSFNPHVITDDVDIVEPSRHVQKSLCFTLQFLTQFDSLFVICYHILSIVVAVVEVTSRYHTFSKCERNPETMSTNFKHPQIFKISPDLPTPFPIH